MSVTQFYEMSPAEFAAALRQENKQVVAEQKLYYNIARYIVTNIWNSAGKSLKKAIRNPEKEMPFAWEVKDKASKVQSLEEMKSQLLSIARHFKDRKQ